MRVARGWQMCVFERNAARPLPGEYNEVLVTLADAAALPWLRAFLRTLRLWGCDALPVVVCHPPPPPAQAAEWARLLGEWGAVGLPFVPVRALQGGGVDFTLKGILHSAPELISARRYIVCDCDVLCFDTPRPLLEAARVLPHKVLAAFDGNGASGLVPSLRALSLGEYMSVLYGGASADVRRLWPEAPGGLEREGLLCNAGIYAGSRGALLGVAGALRQMMPQAWAWQQAEPWSPREQMLWNMAAVGVGAVEVAEGYNFQLHEAANRERVRWEGGRAFVGASPVPLLHFSGVGKAAFADEQARYKR